MDKKDLVSLGDKSLINTPDVPKLLDAIRPAWQSKGLIDRVHKLVKVDPSSACQRLFNAAIHDLREKVVIAGIDIAKEAAKQNALPPVDKPEDIENYSTSKLIDLVYRIGLLSHAEWRRVTRCYEIRRDLEHEDDEYEAGIEDCIYIFKTCIEVILARDPVHLLRVEDVKEIVEKPTPVFPSQSLIEDYKHAPQPRQEKISHFLISVSLDEEKSEILRQNAFILLSHLQIHTQNAVKLRIADYLQQRIGRRGLDQYHARVAMAAGALPYIKQSLVTDFFDEFFKRMEKTGWRWQKHPEHGALLRNFQEIGSFQFCPILIRPKILKWVVKCYVGEEGGMTTYGYVKPVFHSYTAEPIIEEIIKVDRQVISKELHTIKPDKDPHLARRFEKLLDLVDTGSEGEEK